MYYFSPCPLPADESVVSAWDSELRRIKTPWIEQLLAEQGQELFQRFTASYNELRALPRNARRALQRKLARSEDGTIPAEWRRRLAYSIAGAALLVALGQTMAEAAAPKVSTIKVSAKCTLYNAINAAYYANVINQPFNKKTAYYYGFYYHGCKAAPGPNAIILPKTAYTLQYPAIIRSPIIIQGAKPKKPKKGQPFIPGTGGTLHAPAGSAAFYVYYGASLSLYNVTITGGATSGYGGVIYNGNGASTSLNISAISGASAFRGGGIFNSGNLTITGSKISGNTASYGGGIYNYGNLSVSSATVLGTVVVSSTITGNHADYHGGGIYNSYSATISNSTISDNTAARNGGGTANSASGTLSITSSTLTGNDADKGGALHNAYNLAVTSSTISNSTAHYGGGLYNYSGTYATLTGSTVSGNQATIFQYTPNIQTYYYGGKGGGINNHGGLTLNSSTITGNTAQGKKVVYSDQTSYYGGKGGGIYNAGNIDYIDNTNQITTNHANYYGGGLFNYEATGTYAGVATGVITGNTAPTGPDIFPLPPP
jgi:hypothetical protein